MANSMKKIESYFAIAYRAVGIAVVIVSVTFYFSGLDNSAVRAEDKLTAQIEANRIAIQQLRAETRAESEKRDDRFEKLRDKINEAISYIRLIGTNTDRITEIENDVQKNTEEILKK